MARKAHIRTEELPAIAAEMRKVAARLESETPQPPKSKALHDQEERSWTDRCEAGRLFLAAVEAGAFADDSRLHNLIEDSKEAVDREIIGDWQEHLKCHRFGVCATVVEEWMPKRWPDWDHGPGQREYKGEHRWYAASLRFLADKIEAVWAFSQPSRTAQGEPGHTGHGKDRLPHDNLPGNAQTGAQPATPTRDTVHGTPGRALTGVPAREHAGDPAEVGRRAAIREFRAMAEQFDACADGFGKRAYSRAAAVSEIQLQDEAGILLIDCARRGWLHMIPGLEEILRWLDGKDSVVSPPRAATLVRSPGNVFGELVGGNRVKVMNVAGNCEVIGDPEGGLLPALYPALFPPERYFRAAAGAVGEEVGDFHRLEAVSRYKRKAKACHILADLLSSVRTAPKVEPSGQVGGSQEMEERPKKQGDRHSLQPSPRTEGYELFYSFSTKDDDLRERLETHLALLRREGLIREWHFRKIPPGAPFKNEIDKHLNTASIILLLVSADFLASDYCYEIEMKRSIERDKQGSAVVIPIILRECDWHTAPFAGLEALPTDAKPITAWEDQDKAFTDVAKGIRRTISRLNEQSSAAR